MPAGRRIVLTREAQGNAPWLARLQELGLPALDLPLLQYEVLDPPPPAGRWDWVLLTSPQGARAFAAWAGRPAGARLGTLGEGTRAALEAVGLFDELGCNAPDGAALAQAFLASVTAPCRVLLPGAASRLSEPAKTLRAAGYEVLDVPLYRTSAVPPEQLPAAPLASGDVIFFCSPTAVRAFAAAWKDRPESVAIGATTAAVAREAGFPVEVAATPALDAMLEAAGLGQGPPTT